MPKVFQIHEEDLETLERTLPKLAEKLYGRMDNQTRTQLRRVQAIMSKVRWDYGPPTHVETIRADH